MDKRDKQINAGTGLTMRDIHNLRLEFRAAGRAVARHVSIRKSRALYIVVAHYRNKHTGFLG